MEFPLWHKGSVVPLEPWDVGSIPGPAWRVKDPALLVLLQLQHKSQLWLRCDPWPWNSICHGAAKKKKKKKTKDKRKKYLKKKYIYIYGGGGSGSFHLLIHVVLCSTGYSFHNDEWSPSRGPLEINTMRVLYPKKLSAQAGRREGLQHRRKVAKGRERSGSKAQGAE